MLSYHFRVGCDLNYNVSGPSALIFNVSVVNNSFQRIRTEAFTTRNRVRPLRKSGSIAFPRRRDPCECSTRLLSSCLTTLSPQTTCRRRHPAHCRPMLSHTFIRADTAKRIFSCDSRSMSSVNCSRAFPESRQSATGFTITSSIFVAALIRTLRLTIRRPNVPACVAISLIKDDFPALPDQLGP